MFFCLSILTYFIYSCESNQLHLLSQIHVIYSSFRIVSIKHQFMLSSMPSVSVKCITIVIMCAVYTDL